MEQDKSSNMRMKSSSEPAAARVCDSSCTLSRYGLSINPFHSIPLEISSLIMQRTSRGICVQLTQFQIPAVQKVVRQRSSLSPSPSVCLLQPGHALNGKRREALQH